MDKESTSDMQGEYMDLETHKGIEQKRHAVLVDKATDIAERVVRLFSFNDKSV
ncbi:hypothetical protein LCGC14_1385750 [marine sediment metagenome]|uniref:Uncharacterized protein n=1 Tax=marine sediment metagenome TaxID=412755 RepID=A0A0F9KMB4_9ZZZZ